MKKRVFTVLLVLLIVAAPAFADMLVASAVCAVTYGLGWIPVSNMSYCSATGGPAYIAAAGVDVLGACPGTGAYPEAGVVDSATCGSNRVIVSAIGGIGTMRWFVPMGTVWANAVTLNISNAYPEVNDTTNCWLQNFSSSDLAVPC